MGTWNGGRLGQTEYDVIKEEDDGSDQRALDSILDYQVPLFLWSLAIEMIVLNDRRGSICWWFVLIFVDRGTFEQSCQVCRRRRRTLMPIVLQESGFLSRRKACPIIYR